KAIPPPTFNPSSPLQCESKACRQAQSTSTLTSPAVERSASKSPPDRENGLKRRYASIRGLTKNVSCPEPNHHPRQPTPPPTAGRMTYSPANPSSTSADRVRRQRPTAHPSVPEQAGPD